ncbi:unnamed protein product [Caenorhabditis angaria]|uniref:Phospholipid-transporting ATPase n=1 Tax=Caenorhabditis angaria TaxID=860376 RepID=A0A9P1N179_9PELO|nr:unnamed protein product [Caenorhabditis angaria]
MRKTHQRQQNHQNPVDLEASTSSTADQTTYTNSSRSTTDSTSKGHHRRTSSLWVPPSRPIFHSPSQVFREKAENGGRILKSHPVTRWMFGNVPILPKQRVISPNNQKEPPLRYEHPNRKYCRNRISTTKYSLLTFIPKNLFEQLHRVANLYFIFIVILNMIIGAFGKYISVMPIAFVLGITAIKDAFEDYRRYKSDRKINHSTCRVWDASQQRYRKLEWQHILVGDFVHLSHDEIIPADILLLRSSDLNGVCYVETSNLDGESNLKQRQAIRAMGKYHNINVPLEYSPSEFNYKVVCEEPTNDVYKFEGRLEAMENGPPLPREFTILAKENVLLRGCVVKNTDFVEGIVLYAGNDTKAMLNNNGPRYKRSSLEKLTNRDILWSVAILLIMCIIGAIFCGVWLRNYSNSPYDTPFLVYVSRNSTYYNNHDRQYQFDPSFESFYGFWSYIIVLQVMIPISLYVSIEFIKIGQVWFMSQDRNMYYDKVDKRLQCRALNITEELGQIQYVMSDKTGTLTENQMVFRRCSVKGKDYGENINRHSSVAMELVASNLKSDEFASKSKLQLAALAQAAANTGRLRPSRDTNLETQLAESEKSIDDPIFAFFLVMSICNTVVVNAKPHEDLMDEEGAITNSRFGIEQDQEPTESTESTEPLENVLEEEDLINLDSAENSADTRSSPKNSEEFEEIELADISPESKNGNNYNGEKETRKGLASILTQRHSSILSNPFSKLKGLKSPFRRSVDKRASQSDVSQPPPLHSFYDSESPDELALVEAAREYGIRLLKRRFDDVVVYLRHSQKSLKFKVLHTLPFDADRKRMSVIIRENSGKKRVILLTKGADAAILPCLSADFLTSPEGEECVLKSQEHLTEYAKQGLRTLCLSMRIWTEDEYQEWREKHEEAELETTKMREDAILESVLRAESDLELLGVTAIEDRLQDGVPECINSLREAGIRVWVLTGDKIETAVNIAYSSKLFSPNMDLLNIGANGIAPIGDLLNEHLERIGRIREIEDEAVENHFGLVLNGATMGYCIDPHNLERFVQLLKSCRSVLCCRATPLQKAQLVHLAKNQLHGKVLAIGDGANDVSMIQGADVGVGLSGQEGMQAVMSSDFAMARFRFLTNLLLIHGHWNYYRLSQTILYFFYKNAMLVFVVFWYQIFNGFSAQVPIDPVYLMIYNLVFTSVPPLLFGCLDQDSSGDILLKNPELYREIGQYSWWSFWVNMVDAVWQSLAVFWVTYATYHNSTSDMWTFGHLLVCQLMFVNTFHLGLLIQYWTLPMFFSMFLSILAFLAICLLYNGFVTPNWTWTGAKDVPSMIALTSFSQFDFWLALIVTIVICLAPRMIVLVVKNTIWPNRIMSKRIRGDREEELKKKKEKDFTNCLVQCFSAPFRCVRFIFSSKTRKNQNIHVQ